MSKIRNLLETRKDRYEYKLADAQRQWADALAKQAEEAAAVRDRYPATDPRMSQPFGSNWVEVHGRSAMDAHREARQAALLLQEVNDALGALDADEALAAPAEPADPQVAAVAIANEIVNLLAEIEGYKPVKANRESINTRAASIKSLRFALQQFGFSDEQIRGLEIAAMSK